MPVLSNILCATLIKNAHITRLSFLVGAALLTGCANMNTVAPGTPLTEVIKKYGKPDTVCKKDDGTDRLIWSGQPFGQFSWGGTIAKDGKVIKIEQVLTDEQSYRDIFPSVSLQADSKSASRWGTNFNGEYFAIGVGGALAGRGADLFIIDDPHSEQEAKQGRADVFEPAWEWFQSGPVQRLMPGGAIIVVMTRWSKMDLTGKIVDHMTREEDAEEWEVVEFPAILNEKPLWPEFWSIEELLAKKASMDVRYWQAQYMQEPTSEEGALIKREWWGIWQAEDPPPCEHIIMSLDAAQEKTNRADFNALTTWGVFFNEETKNYNVILLNAIKQRLEFPELKALVLEEYKSWQPDSFIVEKKSNGAALYQEFRRMGVPISEFTPGKGQDKISRVNAVSDLFSSGIVWSPDRRWAYEVIEECNDFPSGRNDDLVDATTLALMRFRQGGFLRLPNDEPEPTRWFKSRRGAGYY